jgi:hypothetical protein
MASQVRNAWIARTEPSPWHPRSPGIIYREFYLWGYEKGQIYKHPMLHSLRERNYGAIANVDHSQLRRTWELECCFEVCTVTTGAFIEYLQINFKSFLAVFTLLRVCICSRLKNTPISYHPCHLFITAMYLKSFILSGKIRTGFTASG